MGLIKKLKTNAVLGRGLISLASVGSWSADKASKLATYERHDVTLTIDGTNFSTFTPFSERSYSRGSPIPIPDLKEAVCDTLPEDVLLGLTFATIDDAEPCVSDGYFYFNGTTAVAFTPNRIFIAPCELPLLAEKTQGAFAAVPRLAFTLAMLQTYDYRRALSEKERMPDYGAPLVRFGFDDVEHTMFVNTTSSFTTTHATVAIRCEQEWFDFSEVLDVASIEPVAYARVSRESLDKAKRMSAPVKEHHDAKERKVSRDRQEKADYTLLVSTPHGLTVSGVASAWNVRKSENYGFDLAKDAEADEGFCHVAKGLDLQTALLLDSKPTFGVGVSEKGKTCLVFELPSDGRLLLPAARIRMEEVPDYMTSTDE
jgi:hypothetical protein